MQSQNILGNTNELKSPIIQQGDCILKKCGVYGIFEEEHSSIPMHAEPVSGNLLLKGSSNSHALYGGKFQIFKVKDQIFLRVDETTVLDHVKDLASKAKAEHHAQYIPPGEYFLDELLEYDHLLQESRRIID